MKATGVKPSVKIALVGKYVELHDAYMSVREALKHAALHLGVELDLLWVHSADLEKGRGWDVLKEATGILVPGGFGSRGIEGKIQAVHYARTNNIPYFGLCFGHAADGHRLCPGKFCKPKTSTRPNLTARLNTRSSTLMLDQTTITDLGGTMRLGVYPCQLQPGTIAANAYKKDQVSERHRHRFEFNNEYREVLAEKGLVYSGLSPDGQLVEIAELSTHPFMLGTQFHPEFLSRPTRPHPLFTAFVRAACEKGQIPTKQI